MSDTYGGVTIPVPTTPLPIGDPALLKIGEFAKAVINASARTAWDALRPRDGTEDLPVRFVYTHDPHKYTFNSKTLPALFVYRGADEEELLWQADDWRKAEGRIRLLWIFPPDPSNKHTQRRAFANAVVKVLEAALELGRNPNWVDVGDTDTTADTVPADTDSIKTSIATSTSSASYSGIQLNGVVGTATMDPRRGPTVTTTAVDPGLISDPGDGGAGDDDGGTGGAYNTTDPIVLTFVDWYDQTQTRSVYLTEALGGETISFGEDVKSVVSIDIPPQFTELGSFQFGTLAVQGRGSVLLPRAGLLKLELAKWQLMSLERDVDNPNESLNRRLSFDAVMIHATIHERMTIDSSVHYDPNENTDIDYYKELLRVGRAELPDSNG